MERNTDRIYRGWGQIGQRLGLAPGTARNRHRMGTLGVKILRDHGRPVMRESDVTAYLAQLGDSRD